MAQMRAVVAERPDGPDALVVREVPRPEARPGWALVKVEAFGLNRSEYKALKGYAGDAVTFPRMVDEQHARGLTSAGQDGAPESAGRRRREHGRRERAQRAMAG